MNLARRAITAAPARVPSAAAVTLAAGPRCCRSPFSVGATTFKSASPSLPVAAPAAGGGGGTAAATPMSAAESQILQRLDILRTDVNDFKAEVVGDLAGVKSDLGEVKSDLAGVKKEQSTVRSHLGALWESQLRLSVERIKGPSFAKGELYKSIGDFVRILFKETDKEAADVTEIPKATALLAAALIRENIPAIYLRLVLQSWASQDANNRSLVLKHFGGSMLDDNAAAPVAVSASDIQTFVNAAKSCLPMQLRQKLMCIKDFYGAKDQTEFLCTCRSPGIMYLVLATALHEQKSSDSFNLTWNDHMQNLLRSIGVRDGDPVNIANELEVDCRGSLTCIRDHCTIAQGEIKNNADKYPKAVSQLTLRCLVWKYVVSHVQPDTDRFVLVGYLFVPRSVKREKPEPDIIGKVSIKVVEL